MGIEIWSSTHTYLHNCTAYKYFIYVRASPYNAMIIDLQICTCLIFYSPTKHEGTYRERNISVSVIMLLLILNASLLSVQATNCKIYQLMRMMVSLGWVGLCIIIPWKERNENYVLLLLLALLFWFQKSTLNFSLWTDQVSDFIFVPISLIFSQNCVIVFSSISHSLSPSATGRAHANLFPCLTSM